MTGYPLPGLLILGASGRVGRALARTWPADAPPTLWQHRPGARLDTPGGTLSWGILSEEAPPLPQNIASMIVLAGVTGSAPESLRRNIDLALAGLALARREGIGRVLVASSQAVYGRPMAPVSEIDPAEPTTPYGQSKREMEEALAGENGVTCLRLGNVAGADGLFRAAARSGEALQLDRIAATGGAPRRSYIGPVTLGRVLRDLVALPTPLPPLLNLACPGTVAMDTVLEAAGVPFETRPAPPDALPVLEMDVSRLASLVPLTPVDAQALVNEAYQAGWPQCALD